MATWSHSTFQQFDLSLEEAKAFYDFLEGPEVASRRPAPSLAVIMVAERKAWREIALKMHNGHTLAQSVKKQMEAFLFWQREVYERISSAPQRDYPQQDDCTEEAKVPQALRLPSTVPIQTLPNQRKVRTKAGAEVRRENPTKEILPRSFYNSGQAPGRTRTSRAMSSADVFTLAETAQETATQADPTVAQSSSKMGINVINTTEESTASTMLDSHSVLWVPKAPR